MQFFRGRHRLLATTMLTALVGLSPLPADAANLTWQGSVNNDWSNGQNWLLHRLPTGTDRVTLDRMPQVWLGAGPGLADGLTVGSRARADLFVGTTLSLHTMVLGQVQGSDGTVTVAGSAGQLSAQGMILTGQYGAGHLNLHNASSLSGTGLILGAGATGAGDLLVTGQSALGLSGALTVGSRGAGTFGLHTAATASTGSAVIGQLAGSSGSALITGGGTRWSNAGALGVGASGRGTLEIATGAAVATGTLSAGSQAGGSGSVKLSGGGTTLDVSGQAIIGHAGEGSLLLYTGSQFSADKLTLGYTALGSASLIVGGGDTSLTVSRDLLIGKAGAVSGRIEGGAMAKAGRVVLGQAATSTAALTLSGDGTALAARDSVEIGRSGKAIVTVTGGAALSAPRLSIATLSGSEGTLNIGAASGEIARGAGAVNAARIFFGAGDGRLVFNLGGPVYTLSADLLGRGAVLAEAGSIRLTGQSQAFSGKTHVSGGTLSVDGTLGGIVRVDGYGTLAGQGSVGSTEIGRGGTLSPAGAAAGRLSIAGDLALEAGGHLQATVLPAADVADQVVVSGQTRIAPGAVLDVVQASAIDLARRDRIITSAGGLSGRFDTITSNYAFVTPEVSSTGGDLFLTLTRNDRRFASLAASANGAAAAGAVDSLGATNRLYQQVLPLSAPQAASTFEDLAGAIHASPTLLGFDVLRFGQNAGIDRLGSLGPSDGLFAGSTEAPLGTSLVTAYAEPQASGNPDAFAALLGQTRESGASLWARAYGGWANRTGGDGERTSRAGGFFAGIDAPFGDGWRLGLLAGIGQSRFTEEATGAEGDSTDYTLGFYGSHTSGPLSLRFGGQYTAQDVTTTRQARFNGFAETIDGDYDADAAGFFAEAAYAVAAGGVDFEPFANMALTRQQTDAFHETGGNAALAVSSSDLWLPVSTIGLRAGRRFEAGGFETRLRGMLGWQHSFGEEGSSPVFAFDGSRDFSATGHAEAADSLVVEAGFDVAADRFSTIGITYDGRFEADATSHMVKLNLARQF